jgi:Spy/CpxP family protein refolding chaperone
MSFRNKLMAAAMTAALMSALGINTFAQDPQGPITERGSRPDRIGRQRDREGREKLRGRERGKMRFMRELNLTDAQKQQLRAAGQRNREATKSQREELRQLAEKRQQGTWTAAEEARARALREEIRSSMQGIHSDMLATLTPEQKARLEQMKN